NARCELAQRREPLGLGPAVLTQRELFERFGARLLRGELGEPHPSERQRTEQREHAHRRVDRERIGGHPDPPITQTPQPPPRSRPSPRHPLHTPPAHPGRPPSARAATASCTGSPGWPRRR